VGAVTFWDWLHRLGPGWPSERGWVMLGIFALAGSMLKMAEVHPENWDVELFKALLTLVIGTGLINMILPFFFTANKADETKAENSGKAFDAMKAMAENTTTPQPVQVVNNSDEPVPTTEAPPPVDYAAFPTEEKP